MILRHKLAGDGSKPPTIRDTLALAPINDGHVVGLYFYRPQLSEMTLDVYGSLGDMAMDGDAALNTSKHVGLRLARGAIKRAAARSNLDELVAVSVVRKKRMAHLLFAVVAAPGGQKDKPPLLPAYPRYDDITIEGIGSIRTPQAGSPAYRPVIFPPQTNAELAKPITEVMRIGPAGQRAAYVAMRPWVEVISPEVLHPIAETA